MNKYHLDICCPFETFKLFVCYVYAMIKFAGGVALYALYCAYFFTRENSCQKYFLHIDLPIAHERFDKSVIVIIWSHYNLRIIIDF